MNRMPELNRRLFRKYLLCTAVGSLLIVLFGPFPYGGNFVVMFAASIPFWRDAREADWL
jgi:hypothetical protein